MKYVTIATDISSDDRYGITTWACYIRHEGGSIKRVGQFKEYKRDTVTAETHALLNALVIARKHIPNWDKSKIVIHNEIEQVLDPIRTKAGNIRLRDAVRAEAIESIGIPILQEALTWERRKIKAHYRHWEKSENPAKYYLNRWCDMESRKYMKTLRSKKKKSLKS